MDIDHTLFNHCYALVDEDTRQSLYAFRTHHKPRELTHDGVVWRYVTLGKGQTTAVFLPGAAGVYYIWWQQLLALSEDLRLLSVSYPPTPTLESLRSGLNKILRNEGVEQYHIVGSSLGGYMAQYLASKQPERLLSATFANTFTSTLPFLRAAPMLRLAIRFLPLGLILSIYLWFNLSRLLPAGGNHPLLKAYMFERYHIGFTKQDALARLACITHKFDPPGEKALTFPLLLIESENDPLIRPAMRRAIRDLYPHAQHFAFDDAGHFAYLSRSADYTQVIRSFLLGS
jgi:pimeloyl-ACP methyl ester carboxylesterase